MVIQNTGQRHAFWPEHGLHPGSLSESGPGAQAAAGRQYHTVIEQRSGAIQQVTGGIVYGCAQHGAGRQRVGAGEHALGGQQRTAGEDGGLDRQVIVQLDARWEQRALGQRHARPRHNQIAAKRLDARQQFPSRIVHGFRWRREAIVDAAVDVQVTPGSNHQAPRLARTVERSFAGVRVETGVAIAGQVQIALHHHIAVGGFTRNLYTWSQMEGIGIPRIVQPCQFALQQISVAQGCVDEQVVVTVDAVQVSLVDDLIRPTAGRRIYPVGGIGIAAHGIEPDGPRTLDDQRATGIDGDVIGAQSRCVQFQCAAQATVILTRQGADCRVRAMAQVYPCTGSEGQQAVAGAELDHGPVGRVDNLAVTVDPQYPTVSIQYRAARHIQAMGGRQANIADTFAAGIDQAVHRQAAVVHRYRDLARLEAIADHQVALFELEAATAEDLPGVQALVERSKLFIQRSTQVLRAYVHASGFVGYPRAAGIVMPCTAATDFALQIDLARGV
ncbi:hypothetical protein D3C72_543400 [compost metagenome]